MNEEQAARRERTLNRLRKEPWARLTKLKHDMPDLMEWRHRLRVYEEVLRTSHPQRAHIERVLETERQRVVEEAKTITHFRGLAGMRTDVDISWPPTDAMRVTVAPVQADYTDSETDSEEEEDPRGRPPPYCGPAPQYRPPSPDNDRRGCMARRCARPT